MLTSGPELFFGLFIISSGLTSTIAVIEGRIDTYRIVKMAATLSYLLGLIGILIGKPYRKYRIVFTRSEFMTHSEMVILNLIWPLLEMTN